MHKHIQWLLGQIPDLIDQEVLDQQTAVKLQAHFEPQLLKKGNNPVFLITSLLGAVLIGAGIISLFAYNWEHLSRTTKTILSFLPMVIAMGIYSYGFVRKKDSLAWTESSAGFLMLMLGACLSLIAQTYHIGGTMSEFLRNWMLLSIPLIYLTNSSLCAIFYMAGSTGWLLSMQDMWGRSEGGELFFWVFILALLPHLWINLKQKDSPVRSAILGWGIGISLCIAVPFLTEHSWEGKIFFAYALLFSLLYVSGRYFFNHTESVWQKPFQLIAVRGIFIVSMILAEGHWGFLMGDGWSEMFGKGDRTLGEYLLTTGIAAITLLVSLWTQWQLPRKGIRINPLIALFPLLFLLGVITMMGIGDIVPMILMNLYLLGLSIYFLWHGLRGNRLGLVNTGMIFISSLLVMRFFDSNLGFVLKGVVFILIGVGFIGVNLYLSNQKRKLSHA